MRSDQYIGLNSRAIDLVKELPERYIGSRYIGSFEGAFGNEFGLWSYDDKYFEFVQVVSWSSGPMFFIALKDVDGDEILESLWTDTEIEEF